MLFGAKMVLCALAGLSASLRSAANLPAAAHKTSFLLLITQYTYYYLSNIIHCNFIHVVHDKLILESLKNILDLLHLLELANRNFPSKRAQL
jgi:hypothetical protein